MPTDLLLIHDLAAQAQTTVRTIRYYTDEGLLPQPIIQGKYAYYTQAHLDRLELIRRMKDAYLPLREIRQYLSGLSDAEVRQHLAEAGPAAADRPRLLDQMEPADATDPASLKSQQDLPAPGAPALDYIARLMGETSQHVYAGRTPPGNSSATPAARRLKSPPANPYHISDSSGAAAAGESWQRVVLAPGVELHLRQPLAPDQAARVQQLLAMAQNLFA